MANLFSDGFESGNLTAWSSSATDSGNLSAAAGAALHGSYGLSALINDTNTLNVGDLTPNSEIRYRCRFYIDPNSLTMATNDKIWIINAFKNDFSTTCFLISLLKKADGYYMTFQDTADGSWAVYSETLITDAPHCIEVDWKASTVPGANNGFLKSWIDGAVNYSNTSVDNDTGNVRMILFGATNFEGGTPSGTLYLDDFVSNNDGGEIGPIVTPSALPVGSKTLLGIGL